MLLLQVQPVLIKLFNSRLTRARQPVVVRLLVSSLALMTVEKASICLVVGHAEALWVGHRSLLILVVLVTLLVLHAAPELVRGLLLGV